MDAVKFLKEYKRICRIYDQCKECPINKLMSYGCDLKVYNDDIQSKVVEAIENWSKENSEEIGKKYIIEISRMTPLGKFQVKGTHATFTKAELDFFEEYKESEE